jgi:deazaflavin-dependent oxidoreductase (nitroreductase family)
MTEPAARFLKPTLVDRWINRLFGLLVGCGIGLSHNYLLQVRGRKSGRIYSTPVNIVDLNGKRFLVAARGETQWVRNARASGQIWLKKGRLRQQFRLRPIADEDKPVILKTYLDRFKTTVQRYFQIPAGSPLEAFASIAAQYPVFELVPFT